MIALLIGIFFDWTLAYLAPVFVAPMLQANAPPTAANVLPVLAATVIIVAAFCLIGGFARIYPTSFVISVLPMLCWTFRTNLHGGSTLVVLLVLRGLMLVPMVAKMAPHASWDVAASTVWNIALSLLRTVAMFSIFPMLPSEPSPPAKLSLPEAEITPAPSY